MEFTKKESYVSQIGFYLMGKEYSNAYHLAQEFSQKYSDDLSSHFLLAKTAFHMRKYDEAITRARSAFNMASTKNDMLACAVLLSSSYFMEGHKDEAYKVLRQVDGKNDLDAERLMFIYAVTQKNKAEAITYLDQLYKKNPHAAGEFVQLFF
ncbi:hypothetical protein HY988_04260 [Candidatus Micrarchaeota archaeon]|nr:hypothetical protein [Candidatus Micrarchaeota archaeon]